jgi:hypothetical protein
MSCQRPEEFEELRRTDALLRYLWKARDAAVHDAVLKWEYGVSPWRSLLLTRTRPDRCRGTFALRTVPATTFSGCSCSYSCCRRRRIEMRARSATPPQPLDDLHGRTIWAWHFGVLQPLGPSWTPTGRAEARRLRRTPPRLSQVASGVASSALRDIEPDRVERRRVGSRLVERTVHCGQHRVVERHLHVCIAGPDGLAHFGDLLRAGCVTE